jgi:hypothetical protein
MSGGNIGTEALRLSMAIAKGDDLWTGKVGVGKSKKNKEKIRD